MQMRSRGSFNSVIRKKISSVAGTIRKNRWRYVALFLVPLALASVLVPSAEQILTAIESLKPIEQREKEAIARANSYREHNFKSSADKKNAFDVSNVDKFDDLTPLSDDVKKQLTPKSAVPFREGNKQKELTEKRTENSQTFSNSAGGEITVSSPGNLNYLDNDKKLKPISTKVEVDTNYKPDFGLNGLKLPTAATNAKGFKSNEGSLKVQYPILAKGNGLNITVSGESFSIAPSTESISKPVKNDKSQNVVLYENVWKGVDLEYEYTGTTLKESIVINEKPASNKFVFDLKGALAVADTGDPSKIYIEAESKRVLKLGDLTVNVNKVGNLDKPPVKQVVADGGKQIVVELDDQWLSSQPASSYPIVIDPPVQDVNYIPGGQTGQFTAYKSDGYVCGSSLCDVNTGSLVDGGTKHWRSVVRIPYDQLFGRQLLGADIYLPMRTTAGWHGTYDPRIVYVSWANCNGFNCIGSGPTASAYVGADGTINVTSLMGWMRDNVGSGGSLIIWGEDWNSNSFKQFNPAGIRLNLYTNQYPSQPAPELPSSNSAAQAVITTTEPQLRVSRANDPNGDGVHYQFIIKGSDGNYVWNSGQIQSRQAIVPSNLLQDESTYTWEYYFGDTYWNSSPINGGSFKVDLRTGKEKTQTYTDYEGMSVSLNTGHLATSYDTHSMTALGGDINLNLNYNMPYVSKYGLTAEYYATGTTTPSGNGSYRRVEPNINFDYDVGSPVTGVIPAQNFSTVWTGYFVAPQDGNYEFGSDSDDYMKLTMDWTDIFTHSCCGEQWSGGSIYMTKGQVKSLTVTYANLGGPGKANLLVRGAVPSQPVPTEWLRTQPINEKDTAGLKGAYFHDDGSHEATESNRFMYRTDPTVDFNWENNTPIPGGPTDNFYVKWDGFFTAPADGWYSFGLASDDGARLKVDGSTVVDRWTEQTAPSTYDEWGLYMSSNQRVPIELEYYEVTGSASVSLLLNSPLGTGQIDSRWLSHNEGSLPVGWSISGDPSDNSMYQKLKISLSGDVKIYTNDGTVTTFKTTGSGYTPPTNSSALLIKDSDGTFNLTEQDGRNYIFSAEGNLIIARDTIDAKSPSALRYEYFDQNGTTKLRRIIDGTNSSRYGTLYYQGDAECQTPYSNFDQEPPAGMLCGFGTTDGRFTKLMYYWEKLGLISAPGNADTTFTYYDDGSLYTYRTEFINDAIASGQRPDDFSSNYMIIYDRTGRVQNIFTPKPKTTGIVMYDTFTYYPGATEIDKGNVTEPNGYTRHIEYDNLFRTIKDCDILAKCTDYSYDSTKDLLLATKDAKGLKTTTIYDDVDRPVKKYGPAPDSWFETTRLPKSAYANQIPREDTSFDQSIVGPDVAYYQYEGDLPGNGKLFGSPVDYSNGIATSPGSLSKTWTFDPIAIEPDREGWGVRMTGELRLPSAGDYEIKVNHNDGAKISLDDKVLSESWQPGVVRDTIGGFTHEASKVHKLKVDYFSKSTTSTLKVYIRQVGGFAFTTNWSSYLKPGYGLTTSTTAYDAQTGNVTTSKAYSNPAYGVIQNTTVDPAGLNYQVGQTFDSAWGYFRQMSKTSPGGNVTTYQNYGAYETADNPCTVGTVESYVQAGFVKGKTSPDPDGAGIGVAKTTQTIYDNSGREVANRIGTEAWTCMSYDSRGRLLQIIIPTVGARTGRTVSYNYSFGGNPLITQVGDVNGSTTTEVDLLGRIIKLTDANGNITETVYDNYGKRTQVTSKLGTTTYDYDAYERMTGYYLDGIKLATLTYDAYGRPSGVDYPFIKDANNNTLKTNTPTYDTKQRLTGKSYTLPNGQVVSNTIVRSQSGAIVDESINNIDLSPNSSGFVYDKAGRLTQATLAGHVYQYGFNEPNASCSAQPSNNIYSNKNSNRTSYTVDGVESWYCYDAADRLISSSEDKYNSPTYDSHGNTLTIGAGAVVTSLKYDQSDRNTEISESSTNKVVYKRDHENQIIRRVVTAGTTTSNYYYGNAGSNEGSFMYTNTSTKQVIEKYLVLPGDLRVTLRPTQTTTANKTRVSLQNLHGDTLMTLNGLGAPDSDLLIYEPFGLQTSATLLFTTANPGLVTSTAAPANMQGSQVAGWAGGHKRTGETGLALKPMQMGLRVYIPGLGRFTSSDSVEGGTHNDYVYALDPINSNDYNGDFLPFVGIGIAIARIAIAAMPVTIKLASSAATATRSASAMAGKSSGAINAASNAARLAAQATRVTNSTTKSPIVWNGYRNLSINSQNFKHIIDNHAFTAAQTGKSKFSQGVDILGLISKAGKAGGVRPNPGNPGTFLYEYNAGFKIGTHGYSGKDVTKIRVVVDALGNLITAHPY